MLRFIEQSAVFIDHIDVCQRYGSDTALIIVEKYRTGTGGKFEWAVRLYVVKLSTHGCATSI